MWWRNLNIEAGWIRTVWHRMHHSCQYLMFSLMQWDLITKNNQRSWLYPTCDLSSQAVRISIALATFSLKSSDFCTSFILVFAMKSSGWAGSSWIPVVALATAASPRKVSVSVFSTSRGVVGGQPWLQWASCKAVQCLSHRPGTLPVPLPYPHCQAPESKVKGLQVLGHCSWSHGAAVRPFP